MPLGHAVMTFDLSNVGLDVAGCQALRGEEDDHLVPAGQMLSADDLRLEGPVAVAGQGYLHRPDARQHGLRAVAVAGVVAALSGRVVLVIAKVVGDIALEADSSSCFVSCCSRPPRRSTGGPRAGPSRVRRSAGPPPPPTAKGLVSHRPRPRPSAHLP